MVEVFLSTILVFAIRLRGERWRNEAWSEELEFRAQERSRPKPGGRGNCHVIHALALI
jgi:hypothetical protein